MTREHPIRPLRPACPHGRLRRLLMRALPPGVLLGPSTLRPWASANFVGARHLFPCTRCDGVATDIQPALREQLGAIEWHLPGHIVADLVVEVADEGAALRIEVLTVED